MIVGDWRPTAPLPSLPAPAPYGPGPLMAPDWAADGRVESPELDVPTCDVPATSLRAAGNASCHRLVDYAALDDESLIGLLVQRDARALETLYQRYARPLFSLGLKLLGDPASVEDVVQDVFVRLWSHAGTYESSRGPLLSWLLTITHHRAIDELRRRRRRAEVGSGPLDLAGEADDLASRSLERVEARAAVQLALRELPFDQRRPLELAYYGGLTQVEISRALDVPLGTIKTRMRLGLRKLRELLVDTRAGPN